MTEPWNARSYKKPGMTLAESLGIRVPDDAPGGRPLLVRSGAPMPTRQNAANIEYDGFYDVDGYSRHD